MHPRWNWLSGWWEVLLKQNTTASAKVSAFFEKTGDPLIVAVGVLNHVWMLDVVKAK